MTTNKPEVVAWTWKYHDRRYVTGDYDHALALTEPPYPMEVEPLVRLSDYEALQAECEKLRKDAERYRWMCDGNGYFLEHEMLCGFENEKEQADAAIDAAMAAYHKGD